MCEFIPHKISVKNAVFKKNICNSRKEISDDVFIFTKRDTGNLKGDTCERNVAVRVGREGHLCEYKTENKAKQISPMNCRTT